MLIRICLIAAIIFGLAVGILNFITVKDKIVALQTDLADTKTKLADTTTRLHKTERQLADTKAALDATNLVLQATAKERDDAVTQAAAQTKRANQLADELKKTKDALEDAQAQLAAYKATGFTPEQVLSLGKTLRQTQDTLTAVQDENKLLGQQIVKLKNELAFYRDPQYVVQLPASIKGTVLVSDPKWDFVVLSVGQDQGVLEHGELLVNRNGKLVAKVRVTSVQKDRSIANVMPGWKLGELLEGDQVIPAHPASS